MALKNQSEVNIIEGPEFIKLTPMDLNPLMSQCEIKVFYLGHNRNGSYINKDVAVEMAKTLRGTPIVAAWNDNKDDFSDHGHVLHMEDGEWTFDCKTVPYGFVAPDAKIWFQNFTDTDEFGNQVERTYLMTTGYLWTGQFKELAKVINEGQPQSMELDDETLDGHWATDNNLGIDFFIINDATFTKLCILGDDVEPCFEGSSVTSPQVSKEFSKAEFSNTLFAMMNELRATLGNSEGGLNMSKENIVEEVTIDGDNISVTEFAADDAAVEATEEPVAEVTEEFAAEDEVTESTPNDGFTEVADDKDDAADFVKDDDEKDEDTESDDEDEDKPKPDHSLEEFEAMEAELNSLRAEVEDLRAFKLNTENKEKDALIASYYMLSDAEKADIIKNKEQYTLDEIEAQLALIYVRNNVDFSAGDEMEDAAEPESPATTFSLDDEPADFISPLQAALRSKLN